MEKYCLAIDIGASSGRHILGSVEGGKLRLEEIYRFENYYVKDENGILAWDVGHLAGEVKKGIAECKRIGKIPATVAIDTWGVDYVLLDKDKKELWPAVAYRDPRTDAAVAETEKIISAEELFEKTGIQKHNFNTVYQLWCDKKSGKLDKAEYFLMIPEYLSYILTGVLKNEYTNATTTGLVNAGTKTWDNEIIERLGIKNIFGEIYMPGSEVGRFSGEIQKEVGFDSLVLFCPSHDTASAEVACQITDKGMFISSGTWSLIGTENKQAVLSAEAMNAGFSNEGGADLRICFLKNIMGMWLFQNIRKNLDKKFSYDEMMKMAEENGYYETVDPNDPDFVAPDNMIEAVKKHMKKEEPTLADVINTVYHSLADSYKRSVEETESMSGKTVETINIVGGGSKDGYLNRLTKEYTGKRVITGPVEGTAAGNIISQLMYADKELDLNKAREIIKNSFDIREV